jgi:16S rRNA processing protein RimM
VSRVDHLPAQDLLVVRTAEGEVLVPFVKAIVPEVDIAAGTVTLTPPTGLFEELPDEERPDEELPDEERLDEEAEGDSDAAQEPEDA